MKPVSCGSWVVLFIILLYKINKSRNIVVVENENLLNNVYIGVISGILISVAETGVVYDSIVSKTRKIISMDSVLNKLGNSFVHSLFFFLMGNLFFSIMNSINKSQDIPLWSYVFGICIGFVISLSIIKYFHERTLNIV